jgi:hypothetical protein
MTMDRPVTFSLDGPHDPETTLAAASAIAEGVRYLNYATRPGQGGLKDPADAERLLADLVIAAERLPQLLGQVTVFLKARAATGELEDGAGLHPELLAERAELWLEAASARARDMGASIGKARQDIAGLSVRDGRDG